MKNPQNEVKYTPQKLRPIKLSDEAFELFYKEIYAEFGPKDVPAFDPNAKKEIREEMTEEAAEPVVEEIAEPVAEEIPGEVVEETPEAPLDEDSDNLDSYLELDEEPEAVEEDEEDFESLAEDTAVQEEAAKAAAQIRNVQEDELMDDYDDGEDSDEPKKKGVTGLVITICLELLAIGGVVAYWLLYIL